MPILCPDRRDRLLLEPCSKTLDACGNIYLRRVTEDGLRLAQIGEGDWHIAGLCGLPVNNRLRVQSGFQKTNKLQQRHRMRASEIEDVIEASHWVTPLQPFP